MIVNGVFGDETNMATAEHCMARLSEDKKYYQDSNMNLKIYETMNETFRSQSYIE